MVIWRQIVNWRHLKSHRFVIWRQMNPYNIRNLTSLRFVLTEIWGAENESKKAKRRRKEFLVNGRQWLRIKNEPAGIKLHPVLRTTWETRNFWRKCVWTNFGKVKKVIMTSLWLISNSHNFFSILPKNSKFCHKYH